MCHYLILSLYGVALMAQPFIVERFRKKRPQLWLAHLLLVANGDRRRANLTRLTLCTLLVLQMAIHWFYAHSYWWCLTFVMTCAFISGKLCARVLGCLTDPRCFKTMAIASMLCLIVPALYGVGVSLSALLAASWFWPSTELIRSVHSPSFVSDYITLKSENSRSSVKLSESQMLLRIYENQSS